MATLVILQGENTGKQFPLAKEAAVVGRTVEAEIHLPSSVVSRRHARIWCDDGTYFVEDLGSFNGTQVNGERIAERQPLTDGDELTFCDYVLGFRQSEMRSAAGSATILEQVDARVDNVGLFADKPEHKLQTILLLAQDLGQALELDPLLDRLLKNLLQLFPLADRGLVVLCEEERLVVRAQASRRRGDADFSFSRTVLRKAIAAGRGILSEDIHADAQFSASTTLAGVDTRSLLCVPLIGLNEKRLGAIQLDCQQAGRAFNAEHLRLLTTVSLMAAVVVENAALSAVRIREEALRRDLELGRDIQFGFLPTDFAVPSGSLFEIHARLEPAKQVSGDLYDFFPIEDGRFGFVVGDVSGKGIPAAMFMVKVHTLVRHLAPVCRGPSETLCRLNASLAVNNPSSMFVTLALGIWDDRNGTVTLASGGHPRPLVRRADGAVGERAMPVGRLLGCFEADPETADVSFALDRGETLILFSDGYTEAAAPGTGTMFGADRLKDVLGGAQAGRPLADCAEQARQAIERFTGGGDLQDDLTILLLRRL